MVVSSREDSSSSSGHEALSLQGAEVIIPADDAFHSMTTTQACYKYISRHWWLRRWRRQQQMLHVWARDGSLSESKIDRPYMVIGKWISWWTLLASPEALKLCHICLRRGNACSTAAYGLVHYHETTKTWSSSISWVGNACLRLECIWICLCSAVAGRFLDV